MKPMERMSTLPKDFGRTHSLTLDLVPPPQDWEHGVHSDQSVHTGHTFVLQDSVTSLSPSHCRPLNM